MVRASFPSSQSLVGELPVDHILHVAAAAAKSLSSVRLCVTP